MQVAWQGCTTLLLGAGEFVVRQLEADVARLARAYVSHQLMELYIEIKRLRDGAFELLRGRQIPGRPLTCTSRPHGCAGCPRTSAWTWAPTTPLPLTLVLLG